MAIRQVSAVQVAGERGSTLQFLAGTAALALVLLVLAAGMAIVAVTSSEAEASSHTETNCNEAERHYPELADAGVSITTLEGAVQGSHIGCLPVCVLTYPTLSDPADEALSEVELADLSRYALALDEILLQSELLTLTEAEARMLAADSADPDKGPVQALAALGAKVSGKSVLFKTPTSVYLGLEPGSGPVSEPGSDLGTLEIDFGDVIGNIPNAAEVRFTVEEEGNQCRAFDAAGGLLLSLGLSSCNEVESRYYVSRYANYHQFGWYDHNLEGAVRGSTFGCVPVCVLTYPALSDPADVAGSEVELEDFFKYVQQRTNRLPQPVLSTPAVQEGWVGRLNRTNRLPRSELLTLTEAEARMLAADSADPAKGPVQALAALGAKVSGKSVLFKTPTSVYLGVGTGIDVVEADEVIGNFSNAEVRLVADKTRCQIHDTTGKPLLGFVILVLAAIVVLALGAVAVRGIMVARHRQEA